jgi:hypothetical protein
MRNLKVMFCVISMFLWTIMLGAGPAFAGHAYEMTIVPATAAASFNLYRIDTATGSVVSSNGAAYFQIPDPTPLPQGDYHLRYAQSVDGKTFWLYRMDSQTGRTWSLNGSSWAALTEPK